MWKFCAWFFITKCIFGSFGISVSGKTHKQSVILQEVPLGQNRVLSCGSNGENYIFEYWILENGITIGPSQQYDIVKFDYEVLSGNLLIRTASKEDEGIYTCISRAVQGTSRKAEKIKVLIEHDWEDIYEHDSNINLIRILIILITLALLGIGGYVVFKMWKDRYRYPNYLEHDDEEESIEEVFSRSPGTSYNKILRSPGKTIHESETPDTLTDHSNSTDFKSILEKSND